MVKRYNPAQMVEVFNGGWVRGSDFDAKVEENERLRVELAEARDVITEYRREEDKYDIAQLRIAQLEAALRQIATGGCTGEMECQRVASSALETPAEPDPIYDRLHAEHLKICPMCNPALNRGGKHGTR